MYDSIIIGKGPAGITAAIYLKRYGFNPLIIAKDGGALEKVKEIENYYGFASISGQDLLENGYNQAKRLGIEIIDDEVLSIDYFDSLSITTKNNIYQAKTIILATGTSKNKYILADKYDGVSYCATCDGFFYRNKKVAIIGNTAYMAHELDVLSKICKDITVFTDGQELECNIKNIPVVKEKIVDILGDSHIKTIKTTNNSYDIEGCFIAKGNASAFTLAKHIGIETNGSFIVVDDDYKTNVNGIYAIGDAIGGLLQISKAVGDGAKCATSVSKYLKEHI